MTDQNQALRDDIAFLRTLAEQGRERPMLGGPIMVAAGGLFGTAALAVWGIVATHADARLINVVWAVSAVAYFAVLVPFLKRLPRSAGGMQAATGVAWSGVGWMIFFIGLSLGVLSYRSQNVGMMYAAPSILMGLYGGAWWVAAVLMRKRWLHYVAWASFAMALVAAWTAFTTAIWAIYGVSLYLLLAAPGFVLMRQARKAA